MLSQGILQHYEALQKKKPIQIYWKFHHQKKKIFK